MNCHAAQKLIQDLLDGDLADRTSLDRHLAECKACRAYLERQRRLCVAVAEVVQCQEIPADQEAVTGPVERAIVVGPAPVRAGGRSSTWRTLAPAAMAAMFLLGLLAARTVWPREVTVDRIQRVVETRTKVVHQRVEVPVVRERIVRKSVRVPVVRTRVVIRYVPQPASRDSAVTMPAGAGLTPAALKPCVVMQQLPAPAAAPQVEYSESVRMAAAAATAPGR